MQVGQRPAQSLSQIKAPVSKDELVPIFNDGDDRSRAPLRLMSRDDIKHQRAMGDLNGQYQQNGSIFVLYRKVKVEKLSDVERWATRQSGYAGPLVLQMV